jgi:Fibronectin type III domain
MASAVGHPETVCRGFWRSRHAVGVTTAALTVLLAATAAVTAAAPRHPKAPAAPRGLRTAVSSSALRLRWTEPGSRSGLTYDVRTRIVGAHSWRSSHVGASTLVVERGLLVGRRYQLEARACRGGSCSPWSRPISTTVRGPSTTTPPVGTTGSPTIGGCAVFPSDNAWNRDISGAPVDPLSDAYIASIGAGGHLHPDFGATPGYGIPYVVVPASQPLVPIHLTDFASESDPGPYPVPPSAPVEAGSDMHVLVVKQGLCRLYEMFNASYSGAPDQHWTAAAGAVFNLSSDALRPDGWTSADAAGLPILPGLVRRDEVRAGVIRHAIRMTVVHSQAGFIHPATHFASSSTNPDLPPMGLRLRLKAAFDVSSFPRDAQVILSAMKTYGLIVADNGSNWYFTGATDPSWDDAQLNTLKSVPGSAFEVVQSGQIQH